MVCARGDVTSSGSREVGAGGCRWAHMDAGGCRQVQVGIGGCRQVQTGAGRCRWQQEPHPPRLGSTGPSTAQELQLRAFRVPSPEQQLPEAHSASAGGGRVKGGGGGAAGAGFDLSAPLHPTGASHREMLRANPKGFLNLFALPIPQRPQGCPGITCYWGGCASSPACVTRTVVFALSTCDTSQPFVVGCAFVAELKGVCM